MGKRSDFERVERDFHPTPYEAVVPLLPYLTMIGSFAEPCAGDGALIRHLERHGFHCGWSSDIEPERKSIFSVAMKKLPLQNFAGIVTSLPTHHGIAKFCIL